MGAANNKVLVRMLERLFAGLASGPNLNCRPHSSRQRVDWSQLVKLQDLTPEEALRQLLGEDRKVKLAGRAEPPKRTKKNAGKKSAADATPAEDKAAQEALGSRPDELSPEDKAVQQAWSDQQSILGKLRIVADEARTYEQDTGVHVLNLGLPLLSVPPGTFRSAAGRQGTSRVLAPIAYVPVVVTVRAGTSPTIEIACKGEGIDRVCPNTALLAWLEQQTGAPAGDLFADDAGADPWREIGDLVRHVAKVLDLPIPEGFAEVSSEASPAQVDGLQPLPPPTSPTAEGREPSTPARVVQPLVLKAARAEDDEARPRIVPAAVLGLFPMNNQGLLIDTQALVAGETSDGPLASFLSLDARLEQADDVSYEHEAWSGQKRPRVFENERLVTVSDPCQARAVQLARESRGLVIHGPPGTGKSQTITNIIGDHLARGQRVLMVCDKRTALDVVANRLEHLGLGALCALVHDPRHDQHDLYRSLRERLEQLTDAHSDAAAGGKLRKIDAELRTLHAELTEHWSLLMNKEDASADSFHELVGRWLSVPAENSVKLAARTLEGMTLREFEPHEQGLRNLLERGKNNEGCRNAWIACAGSSLADFLARPLDEVRTAMDACLAAAREADAALHASIVPFAAEPALQTQGEARRKLAKALRKLLEAKERVPLAVWAKKDLAALRRAQRRLAEAAPFLQIVRAGPLDAELALAVRADMPGIAALVQQLGILEAYRAVASKWYGILCWKRRARAAEVLSRHGLPPSRAAVERLRTFLLALRARSLSQSVCAELAEQSHPTPRAEACDDKRQSVCAELVEHASRTPQAEACDDNAELAEHSRRTPRAEACDYMDDEVLERTVSHYEMLFDVLVRAHTEPELAGVTGPLRKAAADPAQREALIEGLEHSAARAVALDQLRDCLADSGLFAADWAGQLLGRLREGQLATEAIGKLSEQLDTLEGVLRIREELAELPAPLRAAAEALLEQESGAEAGAAWVQKTLLAAEVARRLRAGAKLHRLDPALLAGSFERYRALDQQKKDLVRETVLHHWINRQKERLLVSTGSRLNSVGADLRRRLTLRGERALRLRQVVALGQEIEGGDPLFDLCPVWMASPQTVAQVFPRRPVFDVVIFDEASQCRLEEALPVLTRARRVVIAGDPKQLPPTRFFESAVVASEDEDIESEQQLFEVHQGEMEDLLSAALSIDIQQCYLDVHYRSRNADLIQFSNEQFYSARLQPIPGHPSRQTRFAPITLYRAGGVYENRTNPVEAEQVCRIVRDLLKRADPPSIGIACFNLTQRDLIVDKLEELAQEESDFARRLGEARVRRGDGSFEGLFVKNLENVQGDERDHVIISTTYGPDPRGRFYRRFGPLGRAGGGRRLNVLITRARAEVHLVTSIPPDVYRQLPAVPAGQTPGGAWLLFAYLAHAEWLAEAYEDAHHTVAEAPAEKTVNVRPSRSPSPFAAALARHLADRHDVGSDVHWGNDGFCVDVALHHPRHAEDVTIGVLCDGARFLQAEDPVEWDLFRTAVLESQGWRLHRLWSPHFFRDAKGSVQAVLRAAQEFLANEKAKDAIAVVKPADGSGPI